MVGRTLGHYEIIEPLGAGGMGEVYRAHDSTLKRDVDIKVLPEELAADPERLARLEREAQLLAALNHPNIATIYGLEEAEAEGGTRVRFMALELVEGESLAAKLSRGMLEPGKALAFARQIAEALEAAHAKGIIHRDLKPGNVLITPEGQAKVLDFGLAKSDDAETAAREVSPDLTKSPTVAAATRAGVILGTAAYMSPEQARGMPLDNRTDIWSFGCVLYEMLTGRGPFEGETVTDVLAAIVEREPAWNAVPSGAPPLIHVLLRRCLEKDPHERLHHIADARIEIVRAISEPAESPPGASAVVAQPPLWRRVLPWSLAAVAVGVAALSISPWIRPSEEPATAPATTRFVWDLPQGQSASIILPIEISRDGRQVVYVGISEEEQRLFFRSMDQLDVLPIAGTEGAEAPFFSPDGQRIGFAIEDKLYTVPTSGGPPQLLTSYSGAAFAGASWGTDGNIVFADSSLWSVPDAGGVPTLLAEPDPTAGEGLFVIPQHLPGERSILFLDMGTLRAAPNRVMALSLDSGEKRVLIEPGGHARYLPTGHLLYAFEGSLWAVPFDAPTLELRGQPAPVVNRIRMFLGAAAHMTLSDEGTLIYAGDAGEEFAIRLEWRDSQGVVERAIRLNRPGTVWTPRLSPDERTVAFGLEETEDRRSIWTLDVEREVFSLLTPDHNTRSFEWSPDGRWIYFSSDESGNYEIWRRRADASGPPELVLERESHQLVRSISPDGEWLLFAETDAETAGALDIGLLFLAEESDAQLLLEGETSESSAKFSPDGRWIAYTSNESGQREVYVRSFPDLGPRIQISREGGLEPVWSRDGEQLFYRGEFDMMAVDVGEGPRFSAGPPHVELSRDLFFCPPQNAGSYDVTRNGRFLLLNYGGGESQWATGESFVVVLNWFDELKQLVPSGQ